jgi:hypothetical protein
MFKSKHSGWTWDLKRTPFGGGGGGFSGITDSISSALGTDGSGGGALGALASIDPGPAIGSGLASIDQAVNQIPGGWITVAGLAAGGAALAYAPEVMALAASEGITPEAAALATGTAPIDVATGATVPLDTLAADVGTSTGTGLTGGAGGSTGILSGGSTAGLTIPTSTAIAVDPAILAGTGADLGTLGTTSTGAAMGAGLSGTSGLNPALPAAGATDVGTMSAALPSNTVLGTGLEGGGTIGASYQLGANGLPATDILGSSIQGSSVGLNGSTATPTTFSSSDLAKLLQSSAASGASNALQQIAKSNTGMALPNLVRGNQNPFTYTAQQPIQNAQPMDLSALSKLLKQG